MKITKMMIAAAAGSMAIAPAMAAAASPTMSVAPAAGSVRAAPSKGGKSHLTGPGFAIVGLAAAAVVAGVVLAATTSTNDQPASR